MRPPSLLESPENTRETTRVPSYLAIVSGDWLNDQGPSLLGYVHLAGDLASFCFCVGLALALHWGRMKMNVKLPAAVLALLYSAKSFLVLQGVAAGLDFGLLLYPGRPWWVAVEVLLKFAMSLAAGLTFALVVYVLPRLRSVHAGLYVRELADELATRAKRSTPPG